MYEPNVVVFNILNTTLEVYKWVVIISTLLSFVNPDRKNPVVRTLTKLTEPVYRAIRSVFPTTYGGLDFAPLIVLAVIYILQNFILNLLLN